jgi:DNA-binding winged helix-turn-helix (wHTH) protein
LPGNERMIGLGSADFLFEGFGLDRRGGLLFRLNPAGPTEPVPLGARALNLLGVLVERHRESVSKEAIMQAVWPGRVVEEANLNVQIARLRHILGRDCIRTITGHGYRFVAPVTRPDGAERRAVTPVSEGGSTRGPQSSFAVSLVGRVLDGMTGSATADIERAEALVGHALASSHSNPRVHFAKGQVFRAQHRYEEAIAEYETVLALNRNWVLVIAALGWCKFLTGSIEEAISLHEQTIRLSPRDPGIGNWYDRIGRIHLLQSRTDEAIVWLEKARSVNPRNTRMSGSISPLPMHSKVRPNAPPLNSPKRAH